LVLQQQRLAEALGRDDQHHLGGRGIEKIGDLVVEMQQLTAELVKVLRLDILGIDHPRFHQTFPRSTRRQSGKLLLRWAEVNLRACRSPILDLTSADAASRVTPTNRHRRCWT
jgi:hypothetical protein